MIANNSSRRAVGPLRQDDRSCARAEDRAVRRQPGPPRAAHGVASSRPSAPGRTGKAPATASTRRLAAEHAEEIDRRFPKILRRVGGYNLDEFVPERVRSQGGFRFNLARLLVGSEGTLGVTVEAKLRLVELPRARATLVVEFAGLLEALAATPLILQHGPAAVEVVDKYVLDSTRLNPEASRLRDFLQGDPAAILLIEFYGERAELLPPRLAALEDDLRRHGLGDHHLAVTDLAAQARVWKLRTMALGLSMAEKGDAKAISFVEDTAVAPEHLRDYIAEFLAIIARHGTTAGVYAHASVGCLHVRPVINLKTEEGVRKFEAIAAEVADLVLKYGGALSGEHGDGLVRSPFQEKMYGPVLYQAFRELKRTFDPHNLLNPGKIVDAPPLAANLRYGPGYVTPAVPTTFDFTADGGLLPAAELCAGVGACRKKREGTMCPSFQATRDEKDSTRGRANLLRLAITGQLGFEGFTDPARPRGARPVPRMQGLQERVPDQRGHGPAQGGVPASVPSEAWLTLAQPGLRPRGRAGTDRVRAGAGVELAGAERSVALVKRDALGDRPPPRAAGIRAPDTRCNGFRALRKNDRVRSSGTAGASFPRYLHQLLRARDRRGGDRIVRSGRLPRHARSARPALLRPAADLQRPARPGRGQRPAQCRASPRMVARGRTDHRLRAELHPDDPG